MRRDTLATALAIAGIALAAIALNRSGADLAISRLFYDPASASFALRGHPFASGVLHEGAKWLAVALWIAALGAWASARGAGPLRPCRRALGYLLCASLAAALCVATLKALSGHSCPWDLALFGGRFDFYFIFDARPADPGPGRCLPSGHGSVGFMWIAAIYARALLPPQARRKIPRAPLAGGVLAFGLAVSVAQVIRGAHFASHLLFTAAICWTVAWGLALAWRARGAAVT